MNRHAVFHEAKSRWAYAADAETLHIRLRTAHNDVKRVTLTATDPFNWFPDGFGSYSFDSDSAYNLLMDMEYSDDLFDYWFCAITGNRTNRLRYCFILEDDFESLRYGMYGFTENAAPDFTNNLGWFNFPYINSEDVFTPPGWADSTVWYQIFCDRFARDGDNGPVWGAYGDGIHRTLFGGNLKGVISKLPYIADLGFNGIYFTPLFESPSTHKYDTLDYFKIDPGFGTNAEFGELVRKAHDLGIRVMLDAVFNHCGFGHPFFQDVVKNGKNSQYYECFHILGDPVLNFAPGDGKVIPQLTKEQYRSLPYLTFAYTPHMPKWNSASPKTREYLIKSARYWVEEYGIDGWRLDVSNEVSHDFWRELRRELRAVKPDIFLLGENWDDSYPWLMGDQFDSTMNYTLLSAVNGYLTKQTDARRFADSLTRGILTAYPKPLQRVLFNMLDSHDTDRLVSVCGGNLEAARLGYVIQMTQSGSPSVYYGGETAMEGYKNGGSNRRCMMWDEPVPPERDFRPLLSKLIALRKAHPSFRSENISFTDCGSGALAYFKSCGAETLLVVINNSEDCCEVVIPGGDYTDLMSGDRVAGGCDTGGRLYLPAYGFRLLMVGSNE